MSLKTKATVKLGRTVLKLKKNSPGLMFGAGLVTMVGTVVVASRATLQLNELLEKNEQVDNTRENKIHLALEIGKLYAPAVVLGSVSVGCLTGAHVVLNKRNAALTAAYAALDKTYRDYRERVRNEFGDDKERQLNFGIDNADVDRDPNTGDILGHKVAGTPSIYARFFDETSQSWSREWANNRFFLNCQQNYANDKLKARGHIFLNEVYDMLGLERSPAGAVVGWVYGSDGDGFVDFGVFNPSNERARAFVNGHEGAILLDFNVDGVIYDKI